MVYSFLAPVRPMGIHDIWYVLAHAFVFLALPILIENPNILAYNFFISRECETHENH